jgi:hypothetical protein
VGAGPLREPFAEFASIARGADPAADLGRLAGPQRGPGLPCELAEGGRARVEQHFDESRSHQRLRKELARLIARRGGGESLAADSALLAQ